MTESDEQVLADEFEQQRSRLRGLAFRILGSVSDADDAVQEAWMRLSRTRSDEVVNLPAWLTTVVSRLCLDMLRARTTRREDDLDAVHAPAAAGSSPERETELAESVGLALLVVLDRLEPAERVAFVLHDLFAVPFSEIAAVLERTPAAARQLASRGRRRMRAASLPPRSQFEQQRATAEAFLTALRAGDIEGLLAVLDPDVVVRIGAGAGAAGAGATELHGARRWAQGAIAFSRQARQVQTALVDGAPGLILAPGGRLLRVVTFQFDAAARIVGAEILADPARLRRIEITPLPNGGSRTNSTRKSEPTAG